MERKEEKNKFISNYLKENHRQDSYESFAESEDIARACACAIDWADKTIIEKACEFFGEHLGEYISVKNANCGTYINIDGDKLIEDFKKAMEG